MLTWWMWTTGHVRVQAQRSTDYTRASQRASEGASGVERITLLLWAQEKGLAGPRTVVRRQGICNRWERMREELGH